MKIILKRKAYNFFQKNFWSILISLISVASVIFILLFGIGPFVLIVLFGILGFLIGNSIDRGISLLQSFKYFVSIINDSLKRVFEREK